MTFKEVAVDSTSAVSLAHDEDENKLRVNFRHGGVYEYANVDSELFKTILNGSETLDGGKLDSVGAALYQSILSDEKNHPFVRVF